MKIKKISALFGLVAGALMLFSFSEFASNRNCTITLTNHSSGYMGADTYGDWDYIPGGGTATFTGCYCVTEGTYVPYVQAYGGGGSGDYISFTVSNPEGGTTGPISVNGGSYETYQAPDN